MNRWLALSAAAACAVAASTIGADRSVDAFVERSDPHAAGAFAQRPAARPADLVLRNGKVVTVDDSKPEAQAIAATGDTIAAVGSNEEIQAYVGPATRVIDLGGALATPGFIDAHVHFTGVGDAAKNLKLATAKNWDDIVRMVGEAAQKAKPGEWILGRGWHQEKWSETPTPNVEGFPLHEALSRVSPNNPVWLTHASGHAGFANAVAMKMAEVTRATPDPEGGKILRTADGDATGLFNERAQALIGNALARDLATRTPAKVEADLREVIALASREALSKGLTSVHDAGSPPSTIEVMKKVVDEGRLPLRVWMMLREDANRLAADMPKYRVINYGDKRFTVRATKRAIDGALGSRGAWMLEPYADLPSTSGFNTDSLDDVRMIAELAIKNDYQMAIHAIGDRGNREVLNIYEDTFKRHPEKNGRELRWRVEHAQHLSAADIPRFGRLGIIPSMEGIHCTSDAPYVVARLGATRAEEGAYVWQKLMKSGASIANGTDAPVEDIDPIPSFYASVSRRTKDGTVFYPDQRMSRMDALRSYTINAAYAGFEEGIKGSLRPGKLADITVFSQDLMSIPEDRIASTKVLYTIVGGVVQYSAAGAAPTQEAAKEALHFHHVHLNSTNPSAAAAYYPKPFAQSAARTTFNGYDAVKTGNVYLLFTKVAARPQNELTGPQTSIWHFGWNTPDSRKYDERFRAMGLEIARMWDAADGKLVDMSSDTLPGFPTQEQILELRAKGVEPTREGGFGYLRGPDGAMIENAQAGTAERFNHVHMYHEHPRCAMEWYVAHLGATMPQGRGGRGAAAAAAPAGGDCRTTAYAPPTWPSFAKTGFVREPSGGVLFDDISISIRPWPGGGLASPRGKIVDHWALSTANLDATVGRLKREGVKFLEEIHPWGAMRAAMIEGPDRIAIELVEAK